MNETQPYIPAESRYESMLYKRCGRSGIKLPAVSLGLWHNFGGVDSLDNARAMLRRAFDLGITHFDLANNYGPPFGSAEETFGTIFGQDFKPYRGELILSSKAGWDMWPGPYGNWGSRKYLVASLDQSLARMGVDYVDVFYHHRPDPETPLEETMGALDFIVRSGRALYAGISMYPADLTRLAVEMLRSLGTPCLIHQPNYSLFDRWIEDGLLDVLSEQGVGCIVFSPLAQGLLTNKYINGIPAGSRIEKRHGFLKKDSLSPELISIVKKLDALAGERGQTLAQMAIAWLLKDERITSVLVGASSAGQLMDNLGSLENVEFSKDELSKIDNILNNEKI